MEYRCVTRSVEGFVQQLAVSYLRNGYWFYVTGRIPDGKDPAAVDAKLITRYEIGISKWARARRKRSGLANMQYLRHGRFFVLLATHGHSRFFGDEGDLVRDARRVAIKFAGYAISYRNGHPSVRIDLEEYKRLKGYLMDVACHRSAESLAEEFRQLRFEPYAPVRRQLLNILRAVNRERTSAGFAPIPFSCLRFRRRTTCSFAQTIERQSHQGILSRVEPP